LRDFRFSSQIKLGRMNRARRALLRNPLWSHGHELRAIRHKPIDAPVRPLYGVQESSQSITDQSCTKRAEVKCPIERVDQWRGLRKRMPKDLMFRGGNETPGSESNACRYKIHLISPYKTSISFHGPILRIQRPKAR